MALINFNEINCNKLINSTNTVVNFNGSPIEIVKYLSVNDKYDLIMATLQKSFEKNIYNSFKMDIYFELNVIYLYTNIVFSEEDRSDEAVLYDILKRSGLIDMVLAKIDQNELAYLKNCIKNMSETIIKYRNTFGAILSTFVEQLPQNMEAAQSIIGEFDGEKYQDLLSLASKIKSGIIE